jgi:DNA repair protein RecO (recombination protein O)
MTRHDTGVAGPLPDVYALPRVAITFDRAVCVRVWDWSETSQTVVLLTRTHGLIRGIAKGAKRERSNFAGGFEVASLGEAGVSIKRGDQLSLVTSWDPHATFPIIRQCSTAFLGAMALVDAAQSAVQPLDPHPGLFDALVESLERLSRERGPTCACVARFLWTVLDETGHRPEVDRDAATGEPLTRSATYAFSARLGGVVSSDSQPESWKVRSETVEFLRGLARPAPAGTRRAKAETVERATRLLAVYLREVVGREMPAVSAFLDAGAKAGA